LFNNTFAIFTVGWALVKRNQQLILDWQFESLNWSKNLKSQISNLKLMALGTTASSQLTFLEPFDLGAKVLFKKPGFSV